MTKKVIVNEQDYIRKGVELADGWRRRSGMTIETGSIWLIQGPDKFLTCLFSEPKEYILDALVAQLIRQVDATGKYDVEQYAASTIVYESHYPIHNVIKAVTGDNRTMNSLKAIVDSKVLE